MPRPRSRELVKAFFASLAFIALVALRDGRDYRVDVTSEEFVRTEKATGEAARLAWRDVTLVGVIAIDNFPAGHISYVVHGRDGIMVEVPWDTEGNRELLDMMQQKLPGFDNMAVIQSAGMLHGFRQVWPPDRTPSAASEAEA